MAQKARQKVVSLGPPGTGRRSPVQVGDDRHRSRCPDRVRLSMPTVVGWLVGIRLIRAVDAGAASGHTRTHVLLPLSTPLVPSSPWPVRSDPHDVALFGFV
jgi:hypothetical protein